MSILLQNSEGKLSVEIRNIHPIELSDLTESMSGLGSQYSRFIGNKGGKASSAKLYIREMRTGSIIMDLVELLPATALFADLENYNNIIDFAKNLNDIYAYLRGVSDKPEDLQVQDLKNVSAIVEPVAKDHGSIINISGEFNNSPIVITTISSSDANQIQNIAHRMIKESKEGISGFHSKVVFYWNTIKNNSRGNSGDKGVIESISPSPVKTIFSDERIKRAMAFMENENPVLMGYVVDVDVQTIQGRPVLYNILAIHTTV